LFEPSADRQKNEWVAKECEYQPRAKQSAQLGCVMYTEGGQPFASKTSGTECANERSCSNEGGEDERDGKQSTPQLAKWKISSSCQPS